MRGTVISTEQIRKNILKCIEDSKQKLTLTPNEVESVCDAYIRYYVLRADPLAVQNICNEVLRK